MTMPLTRSPLLASDIPTFTDIELAAFAPHPRMPMLFPRGYTPDLYAFYTASRTDDFHNDAESRFMKVIDDETGEVVAASEWTFKLDSAKAESAKKPEEPPAGWPEGGNWAMRRWFGDQWGEWRTREFGGKRYIILNILVTNPQHQKRGAGAMLLAWGLEQADNLGVPVCLESTPAGAALYKRAGFREVRVLKADMKMFGWQQPYDEDAAARIWMIRDAGMKN